MTTSASEWSLKGLDGPSEKWESRLRSLRFRTTPFVHGEFIDGNPESMGLISPINGEPICDVTNSRSGEIDDAVASALRSFRDGLWSRLAPIDRRSTMLRLADAIEEHAEELALLDALCVGKPADVAKGVDLTSAVKAFRWYAELIDKRYGEVAPTANLDIVLREPVGVVAAIVPWNYPLMITAWKIAPMLAAGNSVVLKPSEYSPLSALRLAELAVSVGLPRGVLNVLPGDGETGKILSSHADVRAIGFTGSTSTGKQLFRYASESTMKELSLECGGKSSSIVLEDADLEKAVKGTASGLFYNAGQTCNAPSRLLVPSSKFEEALQLVTSAAKDYMPTHPLSDGATVGAMVSSKQAHRVDDFVKRAVADGATLVTGGEFLFAESGGVYYAPTVLSDVKQDSEIVQEEVFGPVLTLERFESVEDALAKANGTRFGLWANVWTNDLAAGLSLARQLDAGTVGMNAVFGGDITTPFGGIKESGIGRDRSIAAFDKYTKLRHISIVT